MTMFTFLLCISPFVFCCVYILPISYFRKMSVWLLKLWSSLVQGFNLSMCFRNGHLEGCMFSQKVSSWIWPHATHICVQHLLLPIVTINDHIIEASANIAISVCIAPVVEVWDIDIIKLSLKHSTVYVMIPCFKKHPSSSSQLLFVVFFCET